MKKRGVLVWGICGFLCGSVWLVRWVQRSAPEKTPVSSVIVLSDDADRDAFLREQGASAPVCLAVDPIRLPVSVDACYQDYADLQAQQNLPLYDALGTTAILYTYRTGGAADTDRIQLLLDTDGVLVGAAVYDSTNAGEITGLLETP